MDTTKSDRKNLNSQSNKTKVQVWADMLVNDPIFSNQRMAASDT